MGGLPEVGGLDFVVLELVLKRIEGGEVVQLPVLALRVVDGRGSRFLFRCLEVLRANLRAHLVLLEQLPTQPLIGVGRINFLLRVIEADGRLVGALNSLGNDLQRLLAGWLLFASAIGGHDFALLLQTAAKILGATILRLPEVLAR